MSQDGAYATEEPVKIPCEFCSKMCDEDELIVHESGCSPDLFTHSSENDTGEDVISQNRRYVDNDSGNNAPDVDRALSEAIQRFSKSRQGGKDREYTRQYMKNLLHKHLVMGQKQRRLSQQHEPVKIPCEFCGSMCDEDELIVHQSGCQPDIFAGNFETDPGKGVTPQNRRYVDDAGGNSVPDNISKGLFENFQRNANTRQDVQDHEPKNKSNMFMYHLFESESDEDSDEDSDEELDDVRLVFRNQRSSEGNSANITKERSVSNDNISRTGAEPKNNLKECESDCSGKQEESSEPERKTHHTEFQATTGQTPGHRNKDSKTIQTAVFTMEQKVEHDTYGIEKTGDGYVLKKLDKGGDEKISESAKKEVKTCDFCDLHLPLDIFDEHTELCQYRPYECSGCRNLVLLGEKEAHDRTCNQEKPKERYSGGSPGKTKDSNGKKKDTNSSQDDGNDFATRQCISTEKESHGVQKPNSNVHDKKSSPYDDDDDLSELSDDYNAENETVEHFIWKALFKAESMRKATSKSKEVGI